MLRPLLLSCVLASAIVTLPGAALAKGAPTAKQAEKEGQKAEKQGNLDEAKSAYEKALELKAGDIYNQQNYDLFREADDKRNRKSRRKKAQP